MHARICKRHANQAGRGKRAQIPSGGAKSRRLMCMCPYSCPWIGRIRPAGFHYSYSSAAHIMHARVCKRGIRRPSRPGQSYQTPIGRGPIASPRMHVPLFLPMHWLHLDPVGRLASMAATWHMHARICMRYVDQAGRGKATKLPSGGAQSHRLACI